MKRIPNSTFIVFAWYTEAQWDLLCSLVPDRGELDDTYAEWLQSAERAIGMVASNGYKARRVPVDVAGLAAWCGEHHRPMNGKARAEYALYLAQQSNVGS